ncbi:MAG: hypothetical protein VX519_05420 [Myxococcota bacterium]|nr:hypothetical protein [Myxococcota bacterium]
MRWFQVMLPAGLGLMAGCVPLWEPDVSRVMEIPVETLASGLFWQVVAVGALAFLLRMSIAVRAPMMTPARWMGMLIVSFACQVVLSRTFPGTWFYIGVEWLHALAGIGPVVLVIVGMILGLRGGFAGAFPLLLYFVYRDESLLRFVALPAFLVHAADALYLQAKLRHHLSQDASARS